ncbi:hypothetical protein [Neolewinella agarilytica]|uniref:hypothetical protein n=1 Tax=Neolewinella agarilytica TaxID=478744 RepID=UPI002357D3E6|nr:hypothetical protein [Neolewinella agarilytica]
MKIYLPFLLLVGLLYAGCNKQVCRDCPGFTYDAEGFLPDYGAEEIRFRTSEGDTTVFERLRVQTSEPAPVCSVSADEERDIDCNEISEVQYRNAAVGIDLTMNFNQVLSIRNTPEQTVLSFFWKDITQSEFNRTHAVLVVPNIVLDGELALLRDSITIGGQMYTDVLELRQDATAFAVLPFLSNSGRFTSIMLKEGVGLLRLQDVDGKVYVKID